MSDVGSGLGSVLLRKETFKADIIHDIDFLRPVRRRSSLNKPCRIFAKERNRTAIGSEAPRGRLFLKGYLHFLRFCHNTFSTTSPPDNSPGRGVSIANYGTRLV